jgi:hypothetical protein
MTIKVTGSVPSRKLLSSIEVNMPSYAKLDTRYIEDVLYAYLRYAGYLPSKASYHLPITFSYSCKLNGRPSERSKYKAEYFSVKQMI